MVGTPGMPGMSGSFPQGFATGVFGQPGMPGMQNMLYGTSFLPGGAMARAAASAAGILPHPSSHGVAKASKRQLLKSKAKPPPQIVDASMPRFLPEAKAMLVCRVTLGRLGIGGPGLRLPPKGTDAVTCNGGTVFPQALAAAIFAVFDNSQAYPEYIVHFKPH